jgi:kynureninase
MSAHGIVCDWREPDLIRIAPTPLYNRFVDVFDFVDGLAAALKEIS